MYIVFQKNTRIAVAKTATIKRVEQGLATDESIYFDGNGELDYREVDDNDVPADFGPHKYILDTGGSFGLNEDYVEYKTPEQKIAELEARQAATEEALLQLILSQA
ncbi:hypothetical protein [Brevibacillus sp. 1238]|uniref:hypothetical protein n=1 Tax=Brevibacillus sp. 1238 TaxID=2940565 RepID=UPI0024759D04|nr:hypothetical protein [Brevibacillus sp. 1238]MDH6351944.1 hypothetical protein [Brevibacillus sp. 1238]